MWICPKCGRQYENGRCPYCGIEAMNNRQNVEYVMVPRDHFSKKPVNKLCLWGFITSLIGACFAVMTMGIFDEMYFSEEDAAGIFCCVVAIMCGIAALCLCIIGIKKIDRNKQSGYKLAVAGIEIIIVFTAMFAAFAIGFMYGQHTVWHYGW